MILRILGFTQLSDLTALCGAVSHSRCSYFYLVFGYSHKLPEVKDSISHLCLYGQSRAYWMNERTSK